MSSFNVFAPKASVMFALFVRTHWIIYVTFYNRTFISVSRFIVRALQGKLRIGTAQQTVLVALAHAASDAQLNIPEGSALEPLRLVLTKQAEEWRTSGGDKDSKQDPELDDLLAGSDSDGDAEIETEAKDKAKTTKSNKLVTGSLRVKRSVIQDDDEEEEEDEDDKEKAVTVVETTKIESIEVHEAAVEEVSVNETSMTVENEVAISTPTDAATAMEEVKSEAEVNLVDRIASIPEKATPESVKLRSFALALYNAQLASDSKTEAAAHRKLSKELRWQCAEVAVKRAFSECPNLSLLSKHLLTLPLHDLHRASCLSIGLPVAPMLAKPTKQIGEVLKRLSGLAFTVSDSSSSFLFSFYLYYLTLSLSFTKFILY